MYTDFFSIPYAEEQLRYPGSSYVPPPPRSAPGFYANYDSLGNVINRRNRADVVRNVEGYYLGGQQVKNYNEPPRPAPSGDCHCSRCQRNHELEETRTEIRNLRQQQNMLIMFFFVVAIVYLILRGERRYEGAKVLAADV